MGGKVLHVALAEDVEGAAVIGAIDVAPMDVLTAEVGAQGNEAAAVQGITVFGPGGGIDRRKIYD